MGEMKVAEKQLDDEGCRINSEAKTCEKGAAVVTSLQWTEKANKERKALEFQ